MAKNKDRKDNKGRNNINKKDHQLKLQAQADSSTTSKADNNTKNK